jgi:L-ascorbate metabolism protein UlaG (beta-lactamase superfamily)
MRAAARALACLAPLIAGCAAVPVPRSSVFHPSDAALGVTRVVHGTFVLELRGTRLLVDPWFHSGFFVRQREPLGLTPRTLPSLAAVLVSSDDPERFDARALRDLAATVPRAVAPPARRRRLLALGFRDVIALAWWESATVDGTTVTAVPTGTPGVNGWVVATSDVRCFIAGPTAAGPYLAQIAAAFPRLDVAILPIGGDMTPAQAAEAAATLQAARVIPSAYGAQPRVPFGSSSEDALDRFRTAMAARGLAARVLAIETGESWHYGKP